MGYEILSRSGVQQGDPCGPLFFSVAIQPLLEKLSALGIGTRFYLDDGILRGTAAQLEQALIEISAFEAASGLSLNLKKCVLYHAPCGQQLMHCFPRDAECPLDLAEHPILLVDS